MGDNMKAITIKQPWATLIINGYKKHEFRSWKTKYRGELLIHAGKGIDKKAMNKVEYLNLEYPLGKILGKVTLKDCIDMTTKFKHQLFNDNKLIYGDVINQRGYAWELDNPIKFDKYIDATGKLSLWNYKD